jgi:hypothetical protein
VAAKHRLDALAIAHGESDGEASSVGSAALVDFEAGSVAAAPWALLEAPPLLERAKRGWIAAWLAPAPTGTRRALLWRGGTDAELLAEGDELELTDATCRDDRCAILSRLVRGAAAPGATWHTGSAESPASAWAHVDLDLGGDEPWLPLSIAGLTETGGTAALSSGKQVAFFEVRDGRAEKKHVLDTPHGAYDATLAPVPVAVVPGDHTGRGCGAEEFPVVLVGPGGERHVVRTPAPPESVIARPLAAGALVAWVAPVSCQYIERRVVYLTLLDRKGKPVSSPMAVADATGFALATAGEQLSLWLVSGASLSLVRGSCALPADAG